MSKDNWWIDGADWINQDAYWKWENWDHNESFSKNFSYVESVKLSPIVLKPTSSQTLSLDQLNEKMSQALGKIKVASAKVTENGKKL